MAYRPIAYCAVANSVQQDFCKDSTLPVCNVSQIRNIPGNLMSYHYWRLLSREAIPLISITLQLFSGPRHDQNGPWGGCQLKGIPLSNGRHLANLGSIILCGAAIATSLVLLLRSERKRAAVGRR